MLAPAAHWRPLALPRGIAAILLLVSVAGCVPVLALRPRWDEAVLSTLEPARADRLRRIAAQMDEMEGLAGWYRHESAKNHEKRRFAAVLGVALGTVTGGLGLLSASPQVPDQADPVLLGFGASTVVFGAMAQLIPFAHGYDLKENCYARAAAEADLAWAEISPRCEREPADFFQADLDACATGLADRIAALRRFPPGSPCVPPTASELTRALTRARRPGGGS